MTKGKTIFIAHNWQDNTLNRQSKEIALYFSGENKVIFLHAGRKSVQLPPPDDHLTVIMWPGNRPTGIKDLALAIKLMRRNRPDVVISNFGANNIMLLAGWLFGVEKRLCYYHTLISQYIEDKGPLGIKQRLDIIRKNFFWRKATHILASSHSAKKDILKYYKVDESRIYIFPNAIPNKDIANTGQVHKICFVGRLHRSKGVDILIEAFYRLTGDIPGLQLSIAGKGEEMEKLKQQIEKLGIKDKVVFEGMVPNESIAEFIAGHNFLVVPSRMDNLPTVVLEAFSTGTPVLGSNAGGIPDMVEHEKTGLLFVNENVESAYLAMKRLITDRQLWADLSQGAKEKFISRYSLEKLPERFEKLLAGEWKN